MKNLILTLLVVAISIACMSQPTEAEIKKQLTNAGVVDIKFTKKAGTRQWNSDVGNWEYVRGVEVIRKSDYPGVKLKVVGDAVYQYTGVGKYSYWKFRTISNEYDGIPNPAENEIQKIISTDWSKFYGFLFHKIIKLHEQPHLTEDPKWQWHSPNSVSFNMNMKYDWISNNTTVETAEHTFEVRLYRDDIKGEWKNFMSSVAGSGRTATGKKEFTREQVDQMQVNSLANTVNEKTAQQHLTSLPQIDVPVFKNFNDMVRYLHQVLREGTPAQFESVMMQVLSPFYFVQGSKTQLNQLGADLISNSIKSAWKGSATYQQQYCKNYSINSSLSSQKHIYVLGSINNVTTVFGGDQFNEGYREGVPQLKWKLTELRVGVRQDQDAISFISSFSDRKKLCPND